MWELVGNRCCMLQISWDTNNGQQCCSCKCRYLCQLVLVLFQRTFHILCCAEVCTKCSKMNLGIKCCWNVNLFWTAKAVQNQHRICWLYCRGYGLKQQQNVTTLSWKTALYGVVHLARCDSHPEYSHVRWMCGVYNWEIHLHSTVISFTSRHLGKAQTSGRICYFVPYLVCSSLSCSTALVLGLKSVCKLSLVKLQLEVHSFEHAVIEDFREEENWGD